ncbi:hypothetical protein MMC08_000978 [Hypocenomyce scalaris]|nr:hypothetical protein [Hypocenomyce scalaris]
MRPTTTTTTILSLILATLPLLPPALAALGINCRGDRQCQTSNNPGLDKHNDLMDEFYQALANGASWQVPGGPIDPTATWQYGQDVACYATAGVCMYTTGTVTRGQNGINGSVLIDRAGDLNSHGCWYCGSVPLSGDNNPEDFPVGYLVVDYVGPNTGGCNGVCSH